MNLFENLTKLNENEDTQFMRQNIMRRLDFIQDLLEYLQKTEFLTNDNIKDIDVITDNMYDMAMTLDEASDAGIM